MCLPYSTVQVALPNLKWMENHKPLFKVATHAVSSIHPQVGGAYLIRGSLLYCSSLLIKGSLFCTERAYLQEPFGWLVGYCTGRAYN